MSFLDHQRRNEKLHINQRNARGHVGERVSQRQSEILFFESRFEFRGHRFGRFLGDHFQSGRKGVPGANCAAQQIQRFRKALLELAHSPSSLDIARP